MMRRLLAEFVPARRLPKSVWWALGVTLLLSAGLLWRAGEELELAELQLRREQESILSSKERLTDQLQASANSQQIPQPFDASANAWEAERRMPLADTLRLLERVMEDGVAVRSLEMNSQSTLLRLTVDATSHDAVVRFGQALNDNVDHQLSDALRWHLVHSDARTSGQAVQALFEGGIR
jgi:anion-transporting  ArsA/GET3 family ATPase